MVCDQDDVFAWQDGYESIRTPAFIASGKVPKVAKTGKGSKTSTRIMHRWSRDVGLHVQGLVLAGDTLFMAGPPRVNAARTRAVLETVGTDRYELSPELKEATETFAGARGGLLWALSKTDGTAVMKTQLKSIPVFDGLIAANQRLYIATKDGAVVCLAGVDQ